jgi:linoleoyl-CoA desaturase
MDRVPSVGTLSATPLLPSGDAHAVTTAEDFRQLKAAFRARGWYGRPTGRVMLELAWHLATFLVGLTVLLASEAWLLTAAGLLLVTVGLLGVSTNTHTSAHYATARARWINEALTFFGYPFVLQVSATYWWDKHNVRHHPHANVLARDPDIDLSPWVALTAVEVERHRGLRRWYYEQQWLVFPFLIALNSFSFQVAGWCHLIRMLGGRRTRTSKHWVDLAALLMHWGVWIILPAYFVPLSSILAFHVARAVTMGYALFAVLAPCHFPAEAQIITPAERQQRDGIGRQTAASINFHTGPFGRLLCSGLEYHIEHHLFPHMCHVYYPQASQPVAEFCRAHGYPYRSYSWRTAVWKALRNIRRPKQVYGVVEGPGRDPRSR